MKKAGDLVQGFFETYGLTDDKNYLGFMAAWKDIIGDKLAVHSRPSDIRSGTLIVAVDHPGWMTHIRMAERDTLRRIKKRFPQLEISNLAFQLVDRLPPPSQSRQAIERAEQPAPEPDETPNPTVPDAPATGDRQSLFSALDRLRDAMEKKDS
jgi:hypothetical protein